MSAACLYSILLACWMAGLTVSKEISTSKAMTMNDLPAPKTKDSLQPKPNIRPKEPTSKDLIPEEIKDGVLVLGGDDLKTVRAHWVILVTLQAPEYPEGLRAVLNALGFTQRHLKLQGTVQYGWRYRMERMAQVLNTEYLTGAAHVTAIKDDSPRREKRGLVDGVGKVLNYLFGTATEDEIRAYSEATKQLQSRTAELMHVTKGLMTVVDQSRQYMKATRDAVLGLEHHAREVDDYLRAMKDQVEGIGKRLHDLEMRMEMNRAMEEAERTYETYRQQVLHYVQQRSQLERGVLTEGIMDSSLLLQIVEHTAKAGHKTVSDLHWLYRYTAIEPVILSGPTLVYRLSLPVLNQKSYLKFNVNVMPIPIPESSMSLKINLLPQYGISTFSANIFSPTKCIGHAPVVCQSGPLFNSNAHKCARGLIFNQTKLIKHCTFDVTKGNNDTVITQLNRDLHLMSTWGEQIKIRCPNEVERALVLKAGTYKFMCRAPCVLAGQTFEVRCMETFHMGIRVAPPTIRVKGTFNFSSILKAPQILRALPSLSIAPSGTIPNVEAGLIQQSIALDEDHWKQLSKHASWISMLMTVALILVLVISLGGYCYYKKGAPCGPAWLRNRIAAGQERRERHTGLVPIIRYDAPRDTLVMDEAVGLTPSRSPTDV